MSDRTAGIGAPANWDELWAQQQVLTRQLQDRHEQLVAIIQRLCEPASVEAVQLTAAQPVQTFDATPGTLSVGLLNPTASPLPVALGVFGSAGAADAIQVAAGGLIVLPIHVGQVEVAAVGNIGAGVTVYSYLFRFKTVQSLHKQ